MKSLKITSKIRKDPPIKKEDLKNENDNVIKIEKEIIKKKKIKINK
jgi:hypothetical protein